MNLASTISLLAGGPGSGCNPAMGDCGRKGFTTFYHGTTETAAQRIQKEGLKTKHRSPYPDLTRMRRGKVYLTLTPQRAKFYAYQSSIAKHSERPAVVKFSIPNRLASKFEEDWLDRTKKGRSFTYDKEIPAKHVVSVLVPDRMERSGWRENAKTQAIAEVKRIFR